MNSLLTNMAISLPLLAALFPMQEPPCEAHLLRRMEGRMTQLVSTCRSRSASSQQFTYRMLVDRRNGGGQSSNSQQGTFVLEPGQSQQLSQLSINLGQGDSCQARLYILDATGHVVAQDSVIIN